MYEPSDDPKLPLPSFLQMLTSNNVPASKAIAVAGKIYKTHNTRGSLATLTDSKLKSAGVEDKDERKLVLYAIKKADRFKVVSAAADSNTAPRISSASRSQDRPKSDANDYGTTLSQPSESKLGARRKRRRDDDLHEFLRDHAPEDVESYGSLEFKQNLDEKDLMSKSTMSNRAPIMTLWSFVVAERMGFKLEEALSVATAYTEMNAISKGVSLGIYDEDKGEHMEAIKGGTQPYVDLMGRRPLYQTSSGQWRALSKGTPISPSAAFSYVSRTLLQTTAQIVGALRLLAQSYSPSELNDNGYALYTVFRPEVDGWGKKGEVKCSTILGLRKEANVRMKKEGGGERFRPDEEVKNEKQDQTANDDRGTGEGEEPAPKRAHGMTLEEYEAALEADNAFDDLDLGDPPEDPTSSTGAEIR